MEKPQQAVSDESGQTEKEVQNKQQGQAVRVNLDDVPEFRRWKSEQDKRYAAQEKQLREAEEARERLEQQMEALISDPNAKAQFKQQRMETELLKLRAESEARKQMRMFAEKYGVPTDVFSEADSPSEMTDKALRWQKQQLEASKIGQLDAQRASEVQEIENAGGHVVTKAVETSAEMQETDIEKKIRDLRAEALKGGSNAARIRGEILKLQDATRRQAVKVKV